MVKRRRFGNVPLLRLAHDEGQNKNIAGLREGGQWSAELGALLATVLLSAATAKAEIVSGLGFEVADWRGFVFGSRELEVLTSVPSYDRPGVFTPP
jgi:hypothetical protein